MHNHEIRNVSFEDGARVALNTTTGRLSICDKEGDAAELALDSAGAMRLAEIVTAYVAATIGKENEEAAAGIEQSLAGIKLPGGGRAMTKQEIGEIDPVALGESLMSMAIAEEKDEARALMSMAIAEEKDEARAAITEPPADTEPPKEAP